MRPEKLEQLLRHNTPLRVIVCGSCTWTDRETIRRRLNRLPRKTTILVGGARGADTIAEELAPACELQCEVFLAKWDQFGKKAGIIRNTEMLKLKPHLVIAFRMAGESRGTDDMIRRARKKRVPVDVIEKPNRLPLADPTAPTDADHTPGWMRATPRPGESSDAAGRVRRGATPPLAPTEPADEGHHGPCPKESVPANDHPVRCAQLSEHQEIET